MHKIITMAAAGMLLAACTTAGGQKEIGGTLLGGGLGALAGSQIGSGDGKLAATAVGTLLGAFIGRKAGVSLDRADRLAADGAETARYGPSASWARPARNASQPAGEDCERLQSGGLACQGADGTWKVYR
jgi:surface antigen